MEGLRVIRSGAIWRLTREIDAVPIRLLVSCSPVFASLWPNSGQAATRLSVIQLTLYSAMKYQERAMLRDIAHSLTSSASLNMSSNESAVLHNGDGCPKT